MRILVTLILLLASTVSLYSQTLQTVAKDYEPLSSTNCDDYKSKIIKKKNGKIKGGTITPLTDGAFRRYMINQYSYTLLGTNSPTTGLKFETVKPSITLQGNVYVSPGKTFISTLSLTAGVNDGVAEIFSKNKLSSYFQGSASFNWVFNRLGFIGSNYGKYGITDIYQLCHFRSNAILKYKDLKLAGDTLKILTILTSEELVKVPKWQTIEDAYYKGITIARDANEIFRLKNIVSFYLADYNKPFCSDLDAALGKFADYWQNPSMDPKPNNVLVKKYKSLTALSKRYVDSLYTYEIDAVSDVWTTKHIHWFSLTPSFANTNFAQYNETSKAIDQKSTFTPGLKASLNFLWKYKKPHKYVYWTVSAGIQKVNTLEEMTTYTYKKTEQIKVPNATDPNTAETLTSEESGTGYKGVFDDGFGYNITSELYLVPWRKNYAPGFYLQNGFSHGNPWINKDKVGFMFGLIWNVNSSDKESKNLLSVIPYIKWSNLLKEYRDAAHLEGTPVHDLFSAGIKVGIPINIGK